MTTEEPPTITEDSFVALPTEKDVRGVLTTEVALTTRFYDYKAMAEEVDPAQVENMDSWDGLVIEAADGTRGVTFSAIDFDSTSSAQDHFEKMRSEAPPGMHEMVPPHRRRLCRGGRGCRGYRQHAYLHRRG